MSSVQQKFETAVAKHQAGQLDEAAQLYRDVLALQPEQPDALHMLGVIAQQKGNTDLALKLTEAALAKNPKLALAWHNRSLLLRVLGRNNEALVSAHETVRTEPNLADGWDMIGSLLREADRPEEALEYHARAVQLQPDNLRFQSNYAALLLGSGRLIDAYKAVARIKKQDAQFVPFTLGNIFKSAGYPERALECYRETAKMLPNFAEAPVQEAMVLLQMGDMEQGWVQWEKRADNKDSYQHIPRWNGQKVGHLLLHEDQGMGDALQCLRYLSLIRDRADEMTLQITGLLKPLLAENFPDISVITLDDPMPNADAHVQLMSLPYLCNTGLDTIPNSVPYIKSKTEWRAPWVDRLKHLPKPRIGLVWGGNPDNRHDRNRSLNFSQLKPIIDAAGPHLVSLQKGKHRDQADLKTAGIFDAAPFLNDFTDTAGLMDELDLIVTICSSPVHLAGAMGRPAFMMTCFDPHWLWMLERENSPWYPAQRLFRQTVPGDWKPVVEFVAEQLKRFIGGDKTLLQPQRWEGKPARQNANAVQLPDTELC